jgi:sorbitol/mannitol transport system substrate-binding protein
MKCSNLLAASAAGLLTAAAFALPAAATTITIATVNNGDMIIMQKLSKQWEKETGNKVNWVVMEENVLRQKVTTDISTKGGQYDILTIGSYEAPMWGKAGWLQPLDNLGKSYDYADLIPAVKKGLSYKGKLYAVPFYAESSFTLYRKDLFKAAGLTMPAHPTYDQIAKFAAKLTDKSKGIYGICLRGKPGWGENMAFLGTLVNTFGGEWFNMKWQPQIDTPAWKKAITYYVDLMQKYGPPGAAANGFNENQALFQQGKCAMWIDATSAAGRVYDPKQSKVADVTGFTAAPTEVTPKGSAWFWAWSLAIPSTTKHLKTAESFVKWATSKAYVKLVGQTENWVALPPGTRESTYALPEYLKAAPFAKTVLASIESADPSDATLHKVPYNGIQYVQIPEFQGIGTAVGQQMAAALTGSESVDQALKTSQAIATREMKKAGYLK